MIESATFGRTPWWLGHFVLVDHSVAVAIDLAVHMGQVGHVKHAVVIEIKSIGRGRWTAAAGFRLAVLSFSLPRPMGLEELDDTIISEGSGFVLQARHQGGPLVLGDLPIAVTVGDADQMETWIVATTFATLFRSIIGIAFPLREGDRGKHGDQREHHHLFHIQDSLEEMGPEPAALLGDRPVDTTKITLRKWRNCGEIQLRCFVTKSDLNGAYGS